MRKGESFEDSTLLSDVRGDTFVQELDGDITLGEIDNATKRLKEKASGDGWMRKMLMNLPVCLVYALQIIYNTVLSAHTYPTRWRTTIVNEIFKNKETRDKAVEKSSKLKDLGEPWKKVYLNRDKHSVYRYENNRLRKKMNDYRKKPEFQENAKERVKITKGELKVDGNIIDRNTFSSFQ